MSKSSKRGLYVPWNFEPDDFKIYQNAIDNVNITWVSNWELWKPKGLPETVHYVPQCRTANEANQIADYIRGYQNDKQVKCFLGFNEPDIDSQANLKVEKASYLWKTHILPLKKTYPDIKIGSPAVSNGPEGLKWLRSFVDTLGGCQSAGIDFICIHYYSPDVEHFKKYVAEAYEMVKVPIWVTELACTRWDPANGPSDEEVCTFMRDALRFLDETEFVERYAWFGAMRDVGDAVGKSNGLQCGNELSRAGKLYCCGNPGE